MFGGIFDKKLPKKPAGPPPMDLFISMYGKILERYNHAIEDESVLTIPKDVIKAALLAKLSVTLDSELRKNLIGAYTALSSYQTLSDAEKVMVEEYNRFSKDAVELQSSSPSNQKVVVASFFTIYPAYRILLDRVERERSILSEELRKARLI